MHNPAGNNNMIPNAITTTTRPEHQNHLTLVKPYNWIKTPCIPHRQTPVGTGEAMVMVQLANSVSKGSALIR